MEAASNNDGDLSGSSKLGFDAMGAAEYVIKNWILGYPVLGDEANQGPKRKKKKKKEKQNIMWQFCIFFLLFADLVLSPLVYMFEISIIVVITARVATNVYPCRSCCLNTVAIRVVL